MIIQYIKHIIANVTANVRQDIIIATSASLRYVYYIIAAIATTNAVNAATIAATATTDAAADNADDTIKEDAKKATQAANTAINAAKKAASKASETEFDVIFTTFKEYVLNTKLEKGGLSYDFIQSYMQFKMNESDNDEPQLSNILFTTLPDKLNDLSKYGINNNRIIEKLKTTVAAYYLELYTETTNALLNFSDGYYRFTKNQILGIKFTSKLKSFI